MSNSSRVPSKPIGLCHEFIFSHCFHEWYFKVQVQVQCSPYHTVLHQHTVLCRQSIISLRRYLYLYSLLCSGSTSHHAGRNLRLWWWWRHVLRLSTETVADIGIVEDTMTTTFLANLWRNQNLRRAPVIESWTKCVCSRVVWFAFKVAPYRNLIFILRTKIGF